MLNTNFSNGWHDTQKQILLTSPQPLLPKYDSAQVLQYLFERLLGVTFVYNAWAGEDKGDPAVASAMTPECRSAGYAFIRDYGPKSNTLNQFVEWTDEQVHTPDSPIYGWLEARVKESLANYAKGKGGAKTLDRWAVTLQLLYPQILDEIVIPMLATHDLYGFGWMGKSRSGKSTLSKTLGGYRLTLAVTIERVALG